MTRKRAGRWVVIMALGVALGVGLAVLVRALMPPEPRPQLSDAPLPVVPTDQRPGSLAGTILDSEGKPKANLDIRAERTEPMGGPAPTSTRPRVVATTTDQQGNFSFSDLESHKEYIVIAGSREMGWIYEPVNIEPGKEIKLGELKLVKLD